MYPNNPNTSGNVSTLSSGKKKNNYNFCGKKSPEKNNIQQNYNYFYFPAKRSNVRLKKYPVNLFHLTLFSMDMNIL
jgi:hypothetical protein